MNTQNLISQFKAARRVSVPLVAVTTPDPAATIAALADALKPEAPQLVWDVVEGLAGRNEPGKAAAAAVVGENDATIGNPAELVRLVRRKLPAESVVFMHLANRMIADLGVIQGAWNLRDHFKRDRRMLVMLGPAGGVDLPPELAGDVVVFDEPLPDAAALDLIVRKQHESAQLEAGASTVARAVEAVQGLPAFQAEQVVAMSLTKNGVDVPALWERKRRQIELTAGLKVHRDPVKFADVGGVELIKSFLRRILGGQSRPNAVVFVDEIEKFLAGATGGGADSSGVSQDQLGTILSYMQDHAAAGCIFVGPPGCLCGETSMLYRRGKRNSGRLISLERLYRKFNGIKVEGGRGEVTAWRRPCDTYLHSYDHETGLVFYNRILNVRASGKKPCVSLTISSGERLRLTADHPVLTPDGFVLAGELLPGDEVVCRGSMLPQTSDQRAPEAERVIVRGLKHYASGMSADVRDPRTGVVYHYKRQTRARLVVEAEMNGLSYDDYVRALRTDPAASHFKTLPDDKEVHHKNGDSMDDRRGNLEVLSKADHTLAHEPLRRFGVEYTSVETIVFVADAGERETFDIQMAAPANNFATADGLFVHNSAKSMVAKATGNEAGIPTIQLDLGAMKGSLVGQSEQQLRSALKVITSVSNGQSLWVATCNAIGELPPELRRRFTLGTFFFDLPDAKERAAIWKLWLGKYDLPKAATRSKPSDEGWTGAEIRQCCDIAWRLGCPLLDAAQFVVPVSRSAADQLERLRKAADGRFLSASKSGVYTRASADDEAPRKTNHTNRLVEVED